MGLTRETATILAAQTVLGAARMVLETGTTSGTVKGCSNLTPEGTTIEGISKLEDGKIRSSVINAVEAAAIKSKEIRGTIVN